MSGLPGDPRLAAIAGYLQTHGWASWILGPELEVLWISPEFMELVDPSIERHLGKHFMSVTLSDEMRAIMPEKSLLRTGLDLLPMYIAVAPGGREEVRRMIDEELGEGAGAIVDTVPDLVGPTVGSTVVVRLSEGMEPVSANYLLTQLREEDGKLFGVLSMFVSTLPFRFLPLLARGDQAALARTARLADPGHRQAAILFADLQASGVLSARLPSALYFHLIQDLTAAIDRAVTDRAGIVGRHAGDGVTAFFVAEAGATSSHTARAAIEAAVAIRETAAGVAARYDRETDGLVSGEDLRLNIGVHWGNALYMGQLVSNGRLEVTALGDAMNECARIQQCATGGEILASKQVLENLAPHDAGAVGLDPSAIAYQRLADRAGATTKAIRDAGGIPVTQL